ncbi:serine/threonine-protein kinase RIO1-like [Sycon ciliatum]|uniref:serine/threonine-protein kinase RIO1-like n=1 Tax=Sycon ciliatum TaxID=27933 RepID=UPI0031F6CC2D
MAEQSGDPGESSKVEDAQQQSMSAEAKAVADGASSSEDSGTGNHDDVEGDSDDIDDDDDDDDSDYDAIGDDEKLIEWSHSIGLTREQLGGASQQSANMQGKISAIHSSNEKGKKKTKDKADRATVEQVLDPRTVQILHRLQNKGIFTKVNGCISTGKEANVYNSASDAGDRAIKVYKTSILAFKDRSKYVTGDFRFRRGYCKTNPRKMVKMWAEKELRNLLRMRQAGIPCPEPILVRNHVLVMEFLGVNGWPSPRLKDAKDVSENGWSQLYQECIELMRKMYHKCRLIHADLSEFNMLYHQGQLFIIDVSQSVEHDHPQAMVFLRMDCVNVTDFFVKKEVCCMSYKELFNFVTDLSINEDNMAAYLEKAEEKATQRSEEGGQTAKDQVDEEVFKQVFIPRTLDQVPNMERDLYHPDRDSLDTLAYQTVTGLKSDLSGAVENYGSSRSASDGDSDSEEDDDDSQTGSNSNSEDDDKDDDRPKANRRSKGSKADAEGVETRKEHKKKVKEEQREKRKTKKPKSDKKRQKKVASRRRGH